MIKNLKATPRYTPLMQIIYRLSFTCSLAAVGSAPSSVASRFGALQKRIGCCCCCCRRRRPDIILEQPLTCFNPFLILLLFSLPLFLSNHSRTHHLIHTSAVVGGFFFTSPCTHLTYPRFHFFFSTMAVAPQNKCTDTSVTLLSSLATANPLFSTGCLFSVIVSQL